MSKDQRFNSGCCAILAIVASAALALIGMSRIPAPRVGQREAELQSRDLW